MKGRGTPWAWVTFVSLLVGAARTARADSRRRPRLADYERGDSPEEWNFFTPLRSPRSQDPRRTSLARTRSRDRSRSSDRHPTDKPGEPPPAGTRATDEQGGAAFVKRMMRDETLAAVQNLAPIASDLGLSMAQLAVAWVLQNDNVASAIVGASRPEQIADNVKASGVRLDADVMAAIDDALAGVIIDDPSLTDALAPKERP